MATWSEGRRRIASAVGIALLLLAGGVSLLRNSAEPVAYAIGGAFGSVAAGLLLAAAARWLWVRFGPGDPPALDPPPWLLTAGAVALVAGLATTANDARESEEALDQFTGAIERGAETCSGLRTGALGGGVSIGEPTPALRLRLEAQAATAPAPRGFAANLSYFVLEDEARVVAILTTIPVDPATIEAEGGLDTFRRDALAGVRDGAADQGLQAEALEVAGEEAVGLRITAGEYQVSAVAGCNLITSTALDPEVARAGLERVVESGL